MKSRWIGIVGLLSIVVVSAAAAQTPAQSWPQRPVKFIVPFGPGAGADIGARLLSERLPARWGKPVIIENRPGGDSLVAIQAFLSANDDHVLLFAPSGNFTVHPYQFEKLPYTPADLVPLARQPQQWCWKRVRSAPGRRAYKAASRIDMDER